MLSKRWLVGGLILAALILITPTIQAEHFASKTLNNLVNELVSFNFPVSPEEDYLTKPYQEISFERERDGWIYITIDAVLNKSDRVWITLADNLSEKPVLEIDGETQSDKKPETMRFVKAGSYKVKLWSKGRPKLKNIIVRSIPEIIFSKIEFLQKELYYDFIRRYEWDYLNENILDSYNVVVSDDDDGYAPYIGQWRERGRKWLANCGVKLELDTVDKVYQYWGKPMENPLYDGIFIDEFLRSPEYIERYLLWNKAIKKIKDNPKCRDKILYGFTGSVYSLAYKPLLNTLFECGYKFVPEAYYTEQPTENEAESYLKRWYTDNYMEWRRGYPGTENNMVICFSPDNVPPRDCWNTCPNVNFKVYLDKQFYYLTNSPAFKNLYGVTFFAAHYMDEEMLRWFTKLVRHYLIEGNKEMLGEDHYILTHLENPGFEQGEKDWDFSRASPDGIKVINAAEMEFKKGPAYNAIPEGKKILYTKRSGNKPNTISQKIKHLTPGRLYSLKVYNGDFKNFKEKKRISISIRLKGVEVLEEKSRDDVFTYTFPLIRNPDEKTRACWNSHYRVFRAKSDGGELILSDWESDAKADGPENQEIIWDFIELQPYYGAEE